MYRDDAARLVEFGMQLTLGSIVCGVIFAAVFGLIPLIIAGCVALVGIVLTLIGNFSKTE